eukprot:XP_015579995.1 uncharacterized protein LOC107261946 [Ricinus communis]
MNAAAGGKWMDKTAREAITLLEELASQGYIGDETTMAKARGVLEPDTIKMLNAKVDALTNLFGKLLDYLREITIIIPFMDVIRDMPAWGKFLKDIISHKSKLEDYGLVSLIEESKAMYSKSPPKLKDLGSFTVPCAIGGTHINKALCDIGASVSLMPYSIYKRLNLDELKPINMCLSMADKSIKYPLGILENVLTKMGKLIIPADFVGNGGRS